MLATARAVPGHTPMQGTGDSYDHASVPVDRAGCLCSALYSCVVLSGVWQSLPQLREGFSKYGDCAA